MNYKIITITGIAALVVVAGFVYWVLPKPTSQAPASNTPSGSDSGDFYHPYNSTGTSGATPSQDQGPAAVDQQTVYDALFQKLLARRIVFARTASTADVGGEAYALYATDIASAKAAYPGKKDFSIGVAMVDITGDGVPEALVIDDLPGSCGTAGCPFTIYQKIGTSWKSIFATQLQSEAALANVITNGHTDLVLTQEGNDASYQTAVRRYTWDGKKYAYKELLASWDGAKFTVYGQ